MINKIPRVSIGIPAYNEEANIKNLLLSLLKQETIGFILEEIIIVSDGSTDNTDTEVKSVTDKRIKLFRNNKRLGQAPGQNKIIKLFNGDILVLLNADVLPADSSFIKNLIKPFQENKNIASVGPKITPVKAKTFFESIINYSVEFKDAMAKKWKNGNNLYLCRGAGRAFSRDFAKKIFWKDSLSEDAYTFLLCINNRHKFKYESSAELLYKSPDNFADHIKQSARFIGGPTVMSKFFNEDFVKNEYVVPKNIVYKTMLEYFWKNPILFSLYLSIFLLIKINPNKSNYAKNKWPISKSSKKLIYE